MSNPILNSESFDRAAYTLARALENGVHTDNFDHSVTRMGEIVDQFTGSVDKLVTAIAMHNENKCREAAGSAPAYDGEAFFTL